MCRKPGVVGILLLCCLPWYHVAEAQDGMSAITTTNPLVYSDAFKDRFINLFDEDFMELMVDCTTQAPDCDVRGAVEDIVETSEYMLKLLKNFPTGYPYPYQRCESWYLAMVTNPIALRNECADRGQWPSMCLDFGRGLEERANNPTWELPVVCSLVAPGENLERLPTCKQLVSMTIANAPTLHDEGCTFNSREECMAKFCTSYEQLVWRMRPRNLQDVQDEVIFTRDFILPGCEVLEEYNLDQDCEMRLDVAGFCDCLCPAMGSIQTQGYANCPAAIDEYLMFGRLGVANMTFDKDCESELCRVFNERRLSPGCEGQNLPNEHQCLAIQLPQVEPRGEVCPWKNQSGTGVVDVMECLDGHRCNVAKEGWYCCETHRGRAKCPGNLPVMCDTLCSGITEYCCQMEGECTPRACPVPLDNVLYYQELVIQAPNTTFPPAAAVDEERLSDTAKVLNELAGWSMFIWIWGAVGCIAICGCVIVFTIGRMFPPLPDEGPSLPESLEMKNDKFGVFHAFNPEKNSELNGPDKPRICIMMPELPQNRPLGLELLELRVVRVHDWGKRHGWQVGDIIVDIGGQSVKTFEELWERIQIERNRPPVRFTVERWNILNTDQEEEAADLGSPAAPGRKNRATKTKSDTTSKTLRQVANENNMFLPNTVGQHSLNSAAHGWDYEWDDQYDEDGYYEEREDYEESHQGSQPSRAESEMEGYKSRFLEVFEVVKKKEPKPEEIEDAEGDGEGEENAEAAAAKKLEKAMGEKKKANLYNDDAKGKSFKTNRVVFARDAWGRSVVQVQS
mmetsp:Transcript_31443/g.57060  ORF Transcript_31443/g.57060 Transcript_31443/m.57060 type:complete len:793 (-) Transcript_31443:69-2447(-)